MQKSENWKDQGSNESFTLCGFLHQVARGPWLGFGEMPLAGVFWGNFAWGKLQIDATCMVRSPQKTKIDLKNDVFFSSKFGIFSPSFRDFRCHLVGFFRGVSAETWTRLYHGTVDGWNPLFQPLWDGVFSSPVNIWMFPKIGVPQNGWFIMENPFRMDDLGVPLFLETSITSL